MAGGPLVVILPDRAFTSRECVVRLLGLCVFVCLGIAHFCTAVPTLCSSKVVQVGRGDCLSGCTANVLGKGIILS
jgi:hypothetical protein